MSREKCIHESTSASIAGTESENLFKLVGYATFVNRDRSRYETVESVVHTGSLDSCLALYYSMFPNKVGEYDFLKAERDRKYMEERNIIAESVGYEEE